MQERLQFASEPLGQDRVEISVNYRPAPGTALEVVRYEATLADGTRLPGWLQLDPDSGDINMALGQTSIDTITLRIQLRLSDGTVETRLVALNPQTGEILEVTAPAQLGRTTFTQQLAAASRFAATPLLQERPSLLRSPANSQNSIAQVRIRP